MNREFKLDDTLLENIRERVFSGRKELDEDTVFKAVSGDEEALQKVVEVYEPYLEKLSTRVRIDEEGGRHLYVDEEVKGELITNLMLAVIHFDPYWEKKSG